MSWRSYSLYQTSTFTLNTSPSLPSRDGVTNDTAPSNPYSPPIGTPSFLTSNGSIQASPAYTGGNGSNSQEGDASSQGTSAAAKDSALNVLAGARKTVGVAAAVAAVVVGLVVVV